MDLKNELEKKFGIRIYNLYGYGSVYYGTANSKSDKDFKVVSNTSIEYEKNADGYNLHIVSLDMFQKQLTAHNMGFIEAYLHPVYTEIEIAFVFNKESLKHSVSALADNSYVKAKKKLSIEAKKSETIEWKEQNIYLAKKSLFHSMRVLDYAIQLCENNGKIINWNHLVPLYNEIMALPNDPDSWSLWNEQYKKKFNEYKTKFRLARV